MECTNISVPYTLLVSRPRFIADSPTLGGCPSFPSRWLLPSFGCSQECGRRDVKPHGKFFDLMYVEFALSAQHFRYYTLAADFGEIGLRQAVVLHQILEHFKPGGVR